MLRVKVPLCSFSCDRVHKVADFDAVLHICSFLLVYSKNKMRAAPDLIQPIFEQPLLAPGLLQTRETNKRSLWNRFAGGVRNLFRSCIGGCFGCFVCSENDVSVFFEAASLPRGTSVSSTVAPISSSPPLCNDRSSTQHGPADVDAGEVHGRDEEHSCKSQECFSSYSNEDHLGCLQGSNGKDVAVFNFGDKGQAGGQEISVANFGFEAQLGEGAMGCVVEARVQSTLQHDPRFLDVDYVAIKAVRPGNVNNVEVSALKLASVHPHVVDFYDTFQDTRCFYMVMERVDGPDLFDVLRRFGWLEEAVALRVMCQVFDALAFSHDAGCAHMDIKLENVMLAHELDWKGDVGRVDVRLIDFGLAVIVACGQSVYAPMFHSDPCGTPGYCAPELLDNKVFAPGRADVWSAGVLLFELTTGVLPFEGRTLAEVVDCIRVGPSPYSGERWGALRESTQHLIRTCLVTDPQQRPTARAALADTRQILSCNSTRVQ